MRYLSQLRQAQLHDLGGLVFDLYRFGVHRDGLVRDKLHRVIATDQEMREVEARLGEPSARELRHAGVGECPRCGRLYTSDSSFCGGCGLVLSERVARAVEAVEEDAHPTAEEQPRTDDQARADDQAGADVVQAETGADSLGDVEAAPTAPAEPEVPAPADAQASVAGGLPAEAKAAAETEVAVEPPTPTPAPTETPSSAEAEPATSPHWPAEAQPEPPPTPVAPSGDVEKPPEPAPSGDEPAPSGDEPASPQTERPTFPEPEPAPVVAPADPSVSPADWLPAPDRQDGESEADQPKAASAGDSLPTQVAIWVPPPAPAPSAGGSPAGVHPEGREDAVLDSPVSTQNQDPPAQ